jgi:two-component system, NtrC family, sensor kinase
VPGKAVGRAAVELPWLCPKTDSLIALADAPATVTGLSAADPALAIFLLRFAQSAPQPALAGFAPGTLSSALLPETAAAFLAATSAGVLPVASFVMKKVCAVAERAGIIAGLLAETTRRATSESAATVARLAPMGWYAVAAVDAFNATEPLNDPQFPSQPAKVQTEIWGLDHAAIARRLAARWKLPACVATTIGSLTHSFAVATRLVTHPDLFAIVQLAVLETERNETCLGLTYGADRAELLEHLQLEDSTVHAIVTQGFELASNPVPSCFDPNPHRVPLVRNLLRMAGESRRRNGPALVVRLEDRIDSLHTALAEVGELVGERLRAAKLDALAELAAGAGHEINNPLAVISGNAQRLLRTEPDLERAEALRAIVRQANRIAGILRDLMQFARPPRPNSRTVPLGDLLLNARDDLTPLAIEREVRLELEGVFPGLWVEGDVTQLRHALASVIRNGVEAAPPGGWVRISSAAPEEGSLTVVVEDSGSGLSSEAAEHAFDPFFCGRSAGRGRGLGLPTAWQLVRQNGGELRFDPKDGEPTRFVFTLQRAVEHDLLSLRSA